MVLANNYWVVSNHDLNTIKKGFIEDLVRWFLEVLRGSVIVFQTFRRHFKNNQQ